MLTTEEAEEFSQSLGMIAGGAWRQLYLARKLGVPEALGLTFEDWRQQHFSYLRLPIEERREAVKELAAQGESNVAIAEVLGVAESTVRNDKESQSCDPTKRKPKKDNAPRDDDSQNCELSASPSPEQEIGAEKSDHKPSLAVHFSSGTPEHYTPSEIVSAVLACMGEIDLDPCSNSADAPNVPAHQHFTASDDGLSREWHGRIYMNPPYGREIMQWVSKLCAEHEAGRTVEAIALVPARTDTAWFARLRDYPVCFITGRLTFIGNDDPAPFPSAVFYLGDDIGGFYRAFASLGDIWQRLEPDNEGQCWPARFAE